MLKKTCILTKLRDHYLNEMLDISQILWHLIMKTSVMLNADTITCFVREGRDRPNMKTK